MFTQFDLLTSKVLLGMGDGSPTDDEIKKQVTEIFQKNSVVPFKRLTQQIPGGVPFVPVSGMSSLLGSGVSFVPISLLTQFINLIRYRNLSHLRFGTSELKL